MVMKTRILPILFASTLLGGCTTGIAHLETVKNSPKEASIIISSPVRSNVTPMNEALSCFGGKLKAAKKKPISIGIGDIKDYTGKQGQDEGYAITQGGALMAYTALGKIGSGVLLHERFDTRIAEAELIYGEKRQLGDGGKHEVDDPKSGQPVEVPWKPYFGGSIRQSQYFIVGGITELNYNIQSGGAEFAVSNVGPKARIFTMNVAVDLRVVGTQSLIVHDTVSLSKQITGYEVGVGVFRFFGTNLFDVNIGAKNQEPLQLGVRTAIEAAVLELVASVADVDPTGCIPESLGPIKWNGANRAAQAAAEEPVLAEVELPSPAYPDPVVVVAETAPLATVAAAAPVVTETKPEAIAMVAPSHATGGELGISFDPDGTHLNSISLATLDHVASLVGSGRSVNLTISTRDPKSGSDPDLVGKRLDAVVAALADRGVGKSMAKLVWKKSPTQISMSGIGGIQEIARMRVG
jgi:curli biogenesis system outer membrane secretion channel CsgG